MRRIEQGQSRDMYAEAATSSLDQDVSRITDSVYDHWWDPTLFDPESAELPVRNTPMYENPHGSI